MTKQSEKMSTIDIEIIKPLLEKETSTHIAVIRALYKELDAKFNLRASELPITFGYEKDVLGAYVNKEDSGMEYFHFSLLFIGYALENPLSKSDRIDLYKHEYAHYMQYHMDIPKKYQFKPGKHGSAWQYCCSLIGAAPTELYKAGESLLDHDYDKILKKKDYSNAVAQKDIYRRKKQAENEQNRNIKYAINDVVYHPKFKEGIVEAVEQTDTGVRLKIRFGDDLKTIDQKWLLRSQCQKR